VEKSQARQLVAGKIAHISSETRLILSKNAQRHLISLEAYGDARTVCSYIALDDEVSTDIINENALTTGKTVAVPVVDRKNHVMKAGLLEGSMRKGAYGIPEPKNSKVVKPEEFEFVVVPGRAFDRKGNRVGRGAGYYDRFLEKCNKAVFCAICFHCQLVNFIEISGHDIPVDIIVTEEGVYNLMNPERDA